MFSSVPTKKLSKLSKSTEEEYEVKTTTKFVCWKRPEDFGNNGKLVDVWMGGKQKIS